MTEENKTAKEPILLLGGGGGEVPDEAVISRNVFWGSMLDVVGEKTIDISTPEAKEKFTKTVANLAIEKLNKADKDKNGVVDIEEAQAFTEPRLSIKTAVLSIEKPIPSSLIAEEVEKERIFLAIQLKFTPLKEVAASSQYGLPPVDLATRNEFLHINEGMPNPIR